MVESREKSRRGSISSGSGTVHAQLATDLEGLSMGDRLERLAQLQEDAKLYDEQLSATQIFKMRDPENDQVSILVPHSITFL